MKARDPLSVTFAALADPTRRDILDRLRERPQTVSDLARHYPMSRAAVSQHLTVLEGAGMVRRDVRGRWIDCTLQPEALDEAAAWIARQRAEWTQRLDRLDAFLGTENQHETDAEGEQQ